MTKTIQSLSGTPVALHVMPMRLYGVVRQAGSEMTYVRAALLVAYQNRQLVPRGQRLIQDEPRQACDDTHDVHDDSDAAVRKRQEHGLAFRRRWC